MAKLTQGPVKSVGVRTGAPGKGVSAGEAGCIGIQRVTTTGYKEASVGNPRATQLGNANALAAGQGPGAGRTVMKAGSQQGPGPAAPMTSLPVKL